METNTTKHYTQKLYKDMDENDLAKVHEYIKYLHEFIDRVYQGTASRIINALLVSHGGAVVAILTYYNGGATKVSAKELFTSLEVFGLGLILTLLTIGADYVVGSLNCRVLAEDNQKFMDSKILMTGMLHVPDKFFERTCKQHLRFVCIWATWIFGFVAFGLFIYGAIDVWKLFNNVFNPVCH